MKTILSTVVLALCFSTSAYADPAAPCDSQPCSTVSMGPPENVQTVEKDDTGAIPPIELHSVGVQSLPAAEATHTVDAPAPAKPKASLRHYGAGIDVGVPDGAAVSYYWRPTRAIRSSVSGNYNTINEGFRIGLTYLPFKTHGLSATAEGGYFFDGNANKYAGSHQEPVLDAVGYGYANFHLGWDWGQTWGTFFVHGGMSYLHAEIKNVNQQFNDQVIFQPNPILTVWLPSVKLGFIIYF
jgi:hypothetical protein